LRPRDFCARFLDLGFVRRAEGFVEGEADGLDGDVGASWLFEEGAQDAGGDVAAAAYGYDEVRGEVGEDARGGFLAEFMDLGGEGVSVLRRSLCQALP